MKALSQFLRHMLARHAIHNQVATIIARLACALSAGRQTTCQLKYYRWLHCIPSSFLRSAEVNCSLRYSEWNNRITEWFKFQRISKFSTLSGFQMYPIALQRRETLALVSANIQGIQKTHKIDDVLNAASRRLWIVPSLSSWAKSKETQGMKNESPFAWVMRAIH